MPEETEIQLACKMIRLLDGVPIDKAQEALACARTLLLRTQVVSATSPLLAVLVENEATFTR